MARTITPISGAEHDIPPLSPAAAEALAGVDPLDPDAIAEAAAVADDPHAARELRSRRLMQRAPALHEAATLTLPRRDR